MNRESPTLAALAVAAVWVAITAVGSSWLFGGHTELRDIVTGGVLWPVWAAAAFLVLGNAWTGWANTGWTAPRWASAIPLLWLPSLLIAAFLVAAVKLGPPAPATVGWAAVNTAMVGLSEEWMFRGILFRAVGRRRGPWATLWITSAMFGAVHSLNALITGNLGDALLQVLTAFMTGVLLCAVRIRTGSLWPGIVTHWLWDLGIMLLPGGDGSASDASMGARLGMSIALVAPNFLFGLFLMRGASKAPRVQPAGATA